MMPAATFVLLSLAPMAAAQQADTDDLAALRRRIQSERKLGPEARVPALRAFSKLRGDDAAKAARELFSGEKDEVARGYLVAAAHGCDDRATVSWLAAELGRGRSSESLRYEVARVLESTEAGCQVLLAGLRDGDSPGANAARQALGGSGLPTEQLVDKLLDATDDGQLSALMALRFHPRNKRLHAWLVERARDPSTELRALTPADAALPVAEWLEAGPNGLVSQVAARLGVAALRALPSAQPELLARLLREFGGLMRRACWLTPEEDRERWRKVAVDCVLAPGDPGLHADLLQLLDFLGPGSYFGRLAAGLLDAPDTGRILAGIRWARTRANAALQARLQALLEHREAEVRVAAMAALQGPRRADPAWVATLMQYLEDEHVEVRVAAMALLAELAHAPALPRAHAAFGETDWRLRAAACAVCLAVPDRSSVPVLIEALARERGRMVSDVLGALRQLTARDFVTPEQWRQWWQSVRDSFALPASAGDGRKRGNPLPSAPGGTAFFQIPVASDRAVFVLDVSASMAEPFATSGKTKLDIARQAFHRTLAGLPPDTRIDVVAFESSATACWAGLRALDDEAKRAAGAFADGRTPGGPTNLFDALVEALRDPQVDTIYLLTDGEPTVGAVTDPEALARDRARLEPGAPGDDPRRRDRPPQRVAAAPRAGERRRLHGAALSR